jgi:hypothetical protein
MIKDEIIVLDDLVPEYYKNTLERLFFSTLPFSFLGGGFSTTPFFDSLILSDSKYDEFPNNNIYEQFQLVNSLVKNGKIEEANIKYLSFLSVPLITALSKLHI